MLPRLALLGPLFALALASSASPAGADRAPRPAPMPPSQDACLVTIDAPALLEIEHVGDPGFTSVDSRFAVMANGAWTYTERTGRKLLRSQSGCLPREELAALATTLRDATWKTSLADVRCTMAATSSTRYRYQGKPVLTSRVCDGAILEPSTQRAIAHASRLPTTLLRRRP